MKLNPKVDDSSVFQCFAVMTVLGSLVLSVGISNLGPPSRAHRVWVIN
jgi:hypothetical protein